MSVCRWCVSTATFLLAVRVCSVCKAEGGETEGLVPITLRARPVRWVSLRPCTAYSAGASLICYSDAGSHYRSRRLKSGSVACHKFKRTQADPLCLPKILVSEYVLS